MRRRYVSRAFDFHLRTERKIKQAVAKEQIKKEKERGVENDNNRATSGETTKS